MTTFTAGFLVMRWELLSAVMMFLASSLKIKCRQTRHHVMAFLFSGVGLGMSCWFVTGLLGISLSMEHLHNFMEITKNVCIEVLNQAPASWPMP
ncbi:YjcB family protein [[Erwinia] mediterraneensis]|uniref:YjcB family protein n=1 Tax=[Erwinia] mediterraneensis TaxID=2161819 RepID=UPI00102FBE79|nr:YjcB family protein [[Erwinia] mediterraneensis]